MNAKYVWNHVCIVLLCKEDKNPNNYHAICKYFNMTISNSILLYFIRKYTQQRKKERKYTRLYVRVIYCI